MKRFARQTASVLLAGFLLGIHEGKVALWRSGSDAPEQIYDIRTDSLPPADRLILKRGIEVADRRELWAVLENYLD